MPEEENIPVEIVEILGRTGMHGEITQVKCKVLDGYSRGRVITRNCFGPVRLGDVLILLETAREAKKLISR
ncbi:MAG: 30S ribosomal protein S28e [Euryarchaeota archaeon]|nr:30S ribosomal protein S28e [Euryarchaeota archaeon]